MTDRAANHDTLRLTLAILDRLDEVSAISAPELQRQLASEFDRDLRTYQRLLKMLAEQGLAVVQGNDRPLAYRRNRRGAHHAHPLTAEEGLFLQLAQRQLGPLLPPSMAQRLQGLFNRAHMALMPPPLPGSAARSRSSKKADPERERRWARKVGVAPLGLPLLPPEVDPQVSDTVAEALYRDEYLDIDYLPASGRRQIVTDRRNGATDVRRNGASNRWVERHPEGV
ncbi:MAG: hypothetical protein J0L58_20685 [Burkholderiales bacterium]|nr:hypothetical protein [Burkholderiales bacterium]